MNIYQVLRAIQAILASAGVALCMINLINAKGDLRWLKERDINGLRQLTAHAAVNATLGRLTAVSLLTLIGLWGMFVPGEFSTHRKIFEASETLLDTLVVCVVLYVSWQTYHSRRVIIEWHADNPENSGQRIIPDPLTPDRHNDDPTSH
jgi:hypothetical protein